MSHLFFSLKSDPRNVIVFLYEKANRLSKQNIDLQCRFSLKLKKRKRVYVSILIELGKQNYIHFFFIKS